MIRFPNPASGINSIISIFQVLYKYLDGRADFNLDDMSSILTTAGLAASSGYVGQEALAISTREDRSRDPLCNQSKMYAELFRILGWVVSVAPNRALRFRFTLLGDHVAIANVDPKAIFEESALGINYPNELLDTMGTEETRVFSTILRVALELEGYICRDELIIAILNNSDTGEEAIDDIIRMIRTIRGDYDTLSNALNDLADTSNIQINTMRNYTRFPLAVLNYCGWFTSISTNRFYPNYRHIKMLKMTEYGEQRAARLRNMFDVRLSDYESIDNTKREALIRYGFFRMLERSNFDMTPVVSHMENDREELDDFLQNRDILFSPYQTIRPEITDCVLGVQQNHAEDAVTISSPSLPLRELESYQITKIKLGSKPLKDINMRSKRGLSFESIIDGRINKMLNEEGMSALEIEEKIFLENNGEGQDVFYQLVADLFSIIGFNCKVSRTGVNYERWDAISTDQNHSIPIEIKSPAEELYISIKAIRQALENKIILLSRRSYPTDCETTTLVVGYKLPNDRSEVSRLIKDIHNIFGINIGVIDFRSLLRLAISVIQYKKNDFIEKIRYMRGLIDVVQI